MLCPFTAASLSWIKTGRGGPIHRRRRTVLESDSPDTGGHHALLASHLGLGIRADPLPYDKISRFRFMGEIAA